MQSVRAQLLARSQALKKQWLVIITVRRVQRVDAEGAGIAWTKALSHGSPGCLQECMCCARVEQGCILWQHRLQGDWAGSCHRPASLPCRRVPLRLQSLQGLPWPGCF